MASSPPASKTDAHIDIDDLELQAQGYTRAMPRRFSLLSLMSMSYALLATWNGFGSAFGTGFFEASSAGSIWTLTIAAAMTAVTAIGMAELASAYPVAGAQYYWSYVVSTPEWGPFASYMCGNDHPLPSTTAGVRADICDADRQESAPSDGGWGWPA